MLPTAAGRAKHRLPFHYLHRQLVVHGTPTTSTWRPVVVVNSTRLLSTSSSDDREKEIAAELSRSTPPLPIPPPLTVPLPQLKKKVKQELQQHGKQQQKRTTTEIIVDRAGLLPTRMHHGEDDRPPLEGLAKELEQMIMLNGPITVAEYMLHALQHPKHGYYMRQKDKIGRGGDFITAPEISQVGLGNDTRPLFRDVAQSRRFPPAPPS